jgi:hypothetical protein
MRVGGTHFTVLVCLLLGPPGCGADTGAASGALRAQRVSLGADGPRPASVLVLPGGHVEFVNDDRGPHRIASGPHPEHTACPELDGPELAPGSSFIVRMPLVGRVCPYHDDDHVGDASFAGVVDVEAPPFAAPTPITAGGRL